MSSCTWSGSLAVRPRQMAAVSPAWRAVGEAMKASACSSPSVCVGTNSTTTRMSPRARMSASRAATCSRAVWLLPTPTSIRMALVNIAWPAGAMSLAMASRESTSTRPKNAATAAAIACRDSCTVKRAVGDTVPNATATRVRTASGPCSRMTSARSDLSRRRFSHGVATTKSMPALRQAVVALASALAAAPCPGTYVGGLSSDSTTTRRPVGGRNLPMGPSATHVSCPVLAHAARPVSGPSASNNGPAGSPGRRTAAPSITPLVSLVACNRRSCIFAAPIFPPSWPRWMRCTACTVPSGKVATATRAR